MSRSISFQEYRAGAREPEWQTPAQAATPVQQAASTSNGRSPQPYGDRYKYQQKQQAQAQSAITSGLSTAGARSEKFAQRESQSMAQQLIADTLSKATNGRGRNYARAQYLEKQQADKSARYQNGVSSYGSSRAWAEAEKDSYDKLSANVESIAERLRELRLESAYGTAVYQDGIYMGEDEERRSWYDEQLSALGLELSNAEYEQSQAKWKMDEAMEFAEYDAWAEQQAEDQRLYEMAKSAGYDGESWYQGRVLQRDEAQAKVEELVSQRTDLRTRKAYGSVVYQDGVYMGEDENIIAQYDAQIAEVDRQIEEATEELRRKEASLKSAERTRYNDYMTDPNYVFKIASGRMYYEQIQTKDKQAEAVAQQQMKATAMSATPAAGISMAFQAMQADVSSLRPQDNWSKEEESTFLYILGSPGDDSLARAEEYASGVNERYAMEEKYKQLAEVEEWAGKNVLTGTVGSAAAVGGFLASGFDALGNVAEYAATGRITAKPYASITELSNAITTGVKNSLNDWSGTMKIFGDERGLGDMYSVAMSIAQSYAAIAAGGGATGSMLYFFGNGMSNGINDALDRGAKPGQAIAYGTLSAVAEAVSERFSVESLLSGMNAGNVFKAIAKQAGVETSEEGISYLLDRFADLVVLGNKNEYKQAVWSYTIDGMSYDEARKKAMADWLNGFAWTLTSGAISGALSSSAAQLYTGVTSGTGTSPLVPPAQSEPKVEQDAKPATQTTETQTAPTEQAPAITEQAPALTEQAPAITEQAPASTAEQNKTAPVEGAAIKDETSYINNKLRENIPELTNMQTVAQSRAEDVREIPGETMAEKARVLFEKIKGIVNRPGLGEVLINTRSVKDDLSHGVGTAKAAVIPAIPEVIKQGREIDYQEKWKGRNYDGYIFAAPVDLDGDKVYVAAVVKKTSKNKFYLHEVVDSNGNVIKISDGEEANQTSLMSPVDDAGASSPSNSPLKSENSEGVPSTDSIAQAGEEGKGKNTTAATAPKREKSTALESDELSISERPERGTRDSREIQSEIQADAMGRAEQKAKKDIRSFARRLSEKLQSRKSYGTAAADMEWLAGRMLREELPAREVREWARDIAEDMVEKAETTVNDMQEMREQLVSYLKATPLQVGAVEFGDIPQGWRKAHRQVRLHEQGLPIDAAWRELNEMFGEGVFPSDIYSQGDMLMHIGELLDNWKPRQTNPHEGYRDELINEVAEEIYDELNRRVSRAAMDALRAEHKSELNEVRVEERARAQDKLDRKQEQLDKARAQAKALREENKEIKAGMSAAVKTAIEDERTRQEERERRQQLTKSINKNVESLYKKLSENSGKWHVPEEMKSAVAGMLAAIDTRSKRAGKDQQQEFSDRMRELALVISEQTALQAEQGEQAVYLDLPAGVPAVLSHLSYKVKTLTEGENLFTGLDDYVWTLNSMDIEDLQTLSDTLASITHAVNKANYLMGMNATVDRVGNELVREMDGRKARALPNGKIERVIEWDMMTPVYFFRRLGKPGEEIFKALRQGWGEFAIKTERLQKDAEEMWTEREAKDAEKNLITVKLPWRLDENADTETESEALRSDETEEVRLTHAQAMSLYGLYMRPQGRGHILGAGIRIGDIKGKLGRQGIRQDKNYLLTDMDLAEIFNQLTDREREIAKAMSRYMSTVGADWGNAVTLKRWGIRSFTEEFYWPISTDRRNRDARKIEKAGGESLYRLLNMGFTKPLVKNAHNAVDIESAFDVFTNHMVDMAKYNTLALPLLDMMKILNYKQITAKGEKSGKYTTASVQKSLDKVYGEYAQRYWMQLMQDLNGDREGGRRMADPFGTLVSHYKAQSVGANLRVALLQPTSYVRAGLILDSGSMLYGSAHVKGAWKEALKYSGAAKWKNMGYRDSDINANVRELVKHSETPLDKARDWGMRAAEKADQLTWGALWSASKKSVEKEAERAGKKLSHEELIEQTVERFEDVIYRTQVMDSTLTRSAAMRSNDKWTQYATSFMAESTLSYNLVLDEVANAVQEAKSKGVKQAFMDNRKRILRAFFVYSSAMTASAMVASIIDAMRDDDEYESFAKKWVQAFWGEKFIDGNWAGDLSLVRKLPSLKQLVSLIDGYGGGSIEQSALTAMADAWRSMQELLRKEEDAGTYLKDNVTKLGYVSAIAKGLSVLIGLPIASGLRDVVAIWNSTYGTWWGSKVQTYDPGAERSIKYAFEDGALTEESARELLVSEGVSEDADAAYWKVEAWKSGDGEYSKYDKLREAMKEGNKNAFAAAMQELEEHGMYHQSVISDGVVSEIQQMYQGDNAEQIAPVIKKDEAISLLETYGEKRNGEAELLVSKWTSYLDEGIYYGSMKEAYVNEQISFDKAVSMRSKYGMMSEADARAEVLKWQCYKETGIEADNLAMAYAAGEISWEQLRDMYIKYEIYEEEKAASYADKAKFVGLDSYPGISYQATDAYWQYVPDMDKELYYQAWKDTKDMAGEDKDGNGRSDPYTKMDKILEYIDRLNLSKEQKDALARARGIAEKNLKRAPWNK